MKNNLTVVIDTPAKIEQANRSLHEEAPRMLGVTPQGYNFIVGLAAHLNPKLGFPASGDMREIANKLATASN